MSDHYNYADRVIAQLNKITGRNYISCREDIAVLFDTQLFDGNWDASTDWDDTVTGVPNLRIIQEDEFDQSMTDSDKDGLEQICDVGSYYVFFRD